MRACESDGALGGNPSFEVLKCGDLHPVTTEVVPVGGGTDQKSSCAVCYLGEGLRRVWSLAPLVCLFVAVTSVTSYMQQHVGLHAFFSFLDTAFAVHKCLTQCL